MANDPLAAWQAAPAKQGVAVTPHNSTVLAEFRALYIGVSGDVTIKDAAGNTITFANVPVGILPVRGTQVHATGTDATDIVALY